MSGHIIDATIDPADFYAVTTALILIARMRSFPVFSDVCTCRRQCQMDVYETSDAAPA